MEISEKQQAITQLRYGAAESVLAVTSSYPRVEPLATQVQIEVRAASLNPIDWQMIEGNRRLIAPRKFPFVPLFDIAGVVVSVGAKVRRFKVGDAVHADNERDGGGASQYVNVEEELVSHKPELLTFAEAAAVPLAGQTALLALEKGGVTTGSKVCVIGASGGVGSYAVQMSKALGAAHVVAVCSGRNEEWVRTLGADESVDYRKRALPDALAPRSIEVVIDCVGGREQWLMAREILAKGGRFVTISRDEDGPVTVRSAITLTCSVVFRKLRSLFGDRIRYVLVFLRASHRLLDRVDGLIAEGKVRVPLETCSTLTLDALMEQIQLSKSGRMRGKSVLERSGFADGREETARAEADSLRE